MSASNIDYKVNEVKEKKVIFFGNSITQVWSDCFGHTKKIVYENEEFNLLQVTLFKERIFKV